MFRNPVVYVVLVLGGFGLAAMVYAQDRAPTFGERLGALRDNIFGSVEQEPRQRPASNPQKKAAPSNQAARRAGSAMPANGQPTSAAMQNQSLTQEMISAQQSLAREQAAAVPPQAQTSRQTSSVIATPQSSRRTAPPQFQPTRSVDIEAADATLARDMTKPLEAPKPTATPSTEIPLAAKPESPTDGDPTAETFNATTETSTESSRALVADQSVDQAPASALPEISHAPKAPAKPTQVRPPEPSPPAERTAARPTPPPRIQRPAKSLQDRLSVLKELPQPTTVAPEASGTPLRPTPAPEARRALPVSSVQESIQLSETPPIAMERIPQRPIRSEPWAPQRSEEPAPIQAPGSSTKHHARSTDRQSASGDDVLFSDQSPLLSVSTSGPRTVQIGKEASYSINLQNVGQVGAEDVVVKVAVPSWADVVGTKPTRGGVEAVPDGSGALNWRVDSLGANSREKLVLQLVPRESRPFDLKVSWTFQPVASQALVEVREPKLQMELSGPNEVMFGQTKLYKLSLNNPGNGDAENVVITLLPLGDGTDAPVSHKIGDIAAGQKKAIEIELTARQAGTLHIQARATADGGLQTEVAEQVLVRRAGLQLAADGPKVKFAGTPVTYVVRVMNPGNAPAEDVQVTAQLPSGAKFVSCTGGGRQVGDQVQWTLGGLRAGTELELELQCLPNNPGPNRLQLSAAAVGDLEAGGSFITQVDALADLKLEVTDPQGPVAVGQEAQFEVRIRNRGTKSAENVEVVAFFSQGIEPMSAQGGQHEMGRGQVVFAPIPTIAAGSEMVYKIRGRADRAGNHVFRAEVICRTLETKLAAEETTYFYGDGDTAIANKAGGGTHSPSSLDPLPVGSAPRPTKMR